MGFRCGFGFLWLGQVGYELGGEAEGLGCYLGFGGEDAVGGVGGDLFDDLSGGGGFAGLGGSWEVEAGDLEAVEE